MIIHQRTFFCKVGHADAVVQLTKDFKRISDTAGVQARSERIYTDLTGKNDQVVWQVELEHLSDWEEAAPKFFQHADFGTWFADLTSHIEGSDSQFFRLQ